MPALAKTTHEQNLEILRLRNEGKLIKEIILIYNISDDTCRNILKNLGYFFVVKSYKEHYPKIMEMHKSGVSRLEIAEIIGCPGETIDKIVKKEINKENGIVLSRGGNITKEQNKEIEDYYISGEFNSTELAKMYSISPQAMDSRLHKKGIVRLKEKIEASKDTIIQMYNDGKSMPEIAEEMKLTSSGIGKMFKRWNVTVRSPSECHRIYPINEDFFDVIDTQEKAYFLGFIYADGCNHKENNTISINLHYKDRDILYKLSKLIYINNPENHIRVHARRRFYKNIVKFIPHVYLNIHSKHICEVLNNHGCTPRKSLTVKFPLWLKPKLYSHFIRGYYDGDGGIHLPDKKGRSALIGIVGTEDFLISIEEILRKETGSGFSLGKNKNTIEDVWTLKCTGHPNCQRVTNWMYKNSNICLNRKYMIYEKLTLNSFKKAMLRDAGTRGYRKSPYKIKKPLNRSPRAF